MQGNAREGGARMVLHVDRSIVNRCQLLRQSLLR